VKSSDTRLLSRREFNERCVALGSLVTLSGASALGAATAVVATGTARTVKFRDGTIVPAIAAHGVGQIAGSSLEFFVIYFTKSKMTVRVPVRKAAKVGMRKPSDLSAIQAVKQILSEAPRRGRGNWSKQVQEYEGKINSGDILAVAEVVRDLFRPDDLTQSFSERQLYVSSLDRLCGEVALLDAISEEQAVKELEALLKTGKLKRSA
jgi:CarD family transcriptional regulator